MLIFHQVPVACINQAALDYQVPAPLIMAIIETEGGKVGTVSHNENGTFDLGIMQINTTWLTKAKEKGYSVNDLTYNSCKNIDFGTWLLSQCLASSKDILTAVGNYHSHTPYYNHTYAVKVIYEYNTLLKDLTALSPRCKAEGLIC